MKEKTEKEIVEEFEEVMHKHKNVRSIFINSMKGSAMITKSGYDLTAMIAAMETEVIHQKAKLMTSERDAVEVESDKKQKKDIKSLNPITG